MRLWCDTCGDSACPQCDASLHGASGPSGSQGAARDTTTNMVRVSWGGEVVIADLAHVAGDGGNGGDGDQSRPINGVPTPTPTTPTASATPSETPTISPAPTVSPPPTLSPPPRAPTAIVEGLSDGDESAVSTSFSDDHRSLRDDLREDLSSPRPHSPRPRHIKNNFIKISDDDNNNGNNNGNGDKSDEKNGDITISSEEYRRFLTLKGSPPRAPPLPSAPPPPEDDLLTSVDRMLATLSDLEDDLEPIDGMDTESDSDTDEAEARRELLTDVSFIVTFLFCVHTNLSFGPYT